MKKSKTAMMILTLLIVNVIQVFGKNKNYEPEYSKQKGNYTSYVAFAKELSFKDKDSYVHQAIIYIPELRKLHEEYPFILKRAIKIDDRNQKGVELNSKKSNYDSTSFKNLQNIFKIEMIENDEDKLIKLTKKLNSLSAVRYCEILSNSPIPPPGDILPVTPNFQNLQTYLGPNPGVNAEYAWSIGVNGSGVKIRNIEYDFNKNHEEFTDNQNVFLAPDMIVFKSLPNGYADHGTATMGVISANNGNYGIKGIAYGADEVVLYPEYTQNGYDRIYAITQAINNSTAGDIIIFEMQDFGPDNITSPAEIVNVVWDLTKFASENGITIVAAAGNGGANLDAPIFQEYRSRGDSGAIIVGGGSPDLEHDHTGHSNFGIRVNLHAWVYNVYTTGYVTMAQLNYDENQKYGSFSGTSSATAIVGPCVALLQSYYHTLTDNYLTPLQIKNILIQTGIPQGSGGHIGPMPNMEAALNAVNLLSIEDSKLTVVNFFPNPVIDKITIINDELKLNSNINIINSFGQIVYKIDLKQGKTIDLSFLAKGVYLVKGINSENNVFVTKLIKN